MGVSLSLAQASAPYLDRLGYQSAEYLMLAVLMVAAYGLFLMATSQPVIDALVTIEELAQKHSNDADQEER